MTKVLRLVAVGDVVFPNDGAYLKAYNPDDLGRIEATLDVNEALQFSDTLEAVAFRYQISTIKPLRPDGRPNRPLTAYTISFELTP